MFSSQFLKFLISGAIAAGANVGSRLFLSNFTSYEYAIVLAYLTGMSVAFLLMRSFVFDSTNKPLLAQTIKFATVNALALSQTFLVSLTLAYWVFPVIGIIKHAELIAHLFGVAVPIITSYFAHKFFTFRN